MNASDLLNQAQAAQVLGKKESWLERARWAGNGPPFVKVGRSVRYLQEDLLNWLQGQRRTWTRGTRPLDGNAGEPG